MSKTDVACNSVYCNRADPSKVKLWLILVLVSTVCGPPQIGYGDSQTAGYLRTWHLTAEWLL